MGEARKEGFVESMLSRRIDHEVDVIEIEVSETCRVQREREGSDSVDLSGSFGMDDLPVASERVIKLDVTCSNLTNLTAGNLFRISSTVQTLSLSFNV